MAAENFDRALTLVLRSEGGFVNHPSDPGGATNLGITRATLAKSRGRPVSIDDVKGLTRAEAGSIYRDLYWDTVKADDLPAGLDYQTFDYAVNSGPFRAAATLQDVLGVAPDGKIGPLTIAAAVGGMTPDTIRAVSRARMAFLRRLSTWPVFGRGWTSRVLAVEGDALKMAGSAPIAKPSAPPPAKIVEPAPKPTTWWQRFTAGFQSQNTGA